MFERALTLADYQSLRDSQRASREEQGWRSGIGVSVTTEQTGMGATRYKARGLFRIPGFESALVRVEPDGNVHVAVSQMALGQGNLTAYTQIVADSLRLEPQRIRLVQGDTAVTGHGSGTFASRGVVIAGTALVKACEVVKEKLRVIAAAELGSPSAEVQFEDGGFLSAAARRISITQLAQIAYSRGSTRSPTLTHGIEATVYHDPPGMALAATAHVATCKVNVNTGEVVMTGYTIVHDCGRMVNPELVDGQIHGALAQGIGEVLAEAFHHDDSGQPMTINLMEYEIPKARNMMPVRVEAMHTSEGAKTFKGAGETATIGSVPAVTSAIRDALKGMGVDICELPLTAVKLRKLLGEARVKKAEISPPSGVTLAPYPSRDAPLEVG
jgi:carbon-monoxide dehydrogenase large subunit